MSPPPMNRTEPASTSEITLSSSSPSSQGRGLPLSSSTDDFSSSLSLITDHISSRAASLPSLPTLPPPDDIASALDSLETDVPEEGMGTKKVVEHLLEDIVKGLAPGHAGPRYFGFVIGGVTPAAQLADILVSSYDQNVQVHLPSDTISTHLESLTLHLVLSLLSLPPSLFLGRTLTTGATASNILGLSTARDSFAFRSAPPGWCIAEDGYPPGFGGGGSIEVLGVKAHASVIKAAAVVGIGRKNYVDLGREDEGEGVLDFDLERLAERMLANETAGKKTIVAVGLGEVNTGGFTMQIPKLRELCDRFGGWLHVDAAFGGFAALLPRLSHFTEHLSLADSITLDGHKWLNCPYDLGLFFCRSADALPRTFGPSPSLAPPAYLTPPPPPPPLPSPSSSSSSSSTSPASSRAALFPPTPSPLNVNLENSRRFRALPLYASLLSLGRTGYASIVQNNVRLAEMIAEWMLDCSDPSVRSSLGDQGGAEGERGGGGGDGQDNGGGGGSRFFELLNRTEVVQGRPRLQGEGVVPLNIVLFRGSRRLPAECPFHPDRPDQGPALARLINTGREIYVSATSWKGEGAVRIAVSNHLAGPDTFLAVRRALENVGRGPW